MHSRNHDAIVILCSYLCLGDGVVPFTIKEWSTFAEKLVKVNKEPQDILDFNEDIQQLLELDQNEINRINRLLERSASLTFEIEKLNRMGINIVTRSDLEYPKRIKQALTKKSPPLFYYCGNLNLLNNELVGFVGSRTISDDDIKFTENAVDYFSREGYSFVSGGAKGIDRTATEHAIDNGNCAIEVLSDSLIRRIKEPKIFKAVIDDKLLLISQSIPTAGFDVGSAMQRNKYIYSLSKFTIVVKSDYNKGGTWTGAKEAITQKLSDVCCWDNLEYLGNQKLIELGASKVDLNFNIIKTIDLADSIKETSVKPKKNKAKQLSIYDFDVLK